MSAAASLPFLAVPRNRGDEACAVLSPVAFKVWYRIARLTCGWRDQDEQGTWKPREEAYISYSDFQRACGIKNHKTVTRALKEIITKGFARLVASLGIRGAHAYALIDSTTGKNPVVTPDTPTNITSLREKIPQSSGKYSPSSTGKNPVVASSQPAPEAAPREAIETLIETCIEKEEETYYVAGATSVDEIVDNQVEQEDAMHPGASVTQDDGYPFKSLELPAKRPQQRSLFSSGSQKRSNAAQQRSEESLPARRLHESEQAENGESEEITYYRELLIKQRRQLKDEEDYLGMCENAAKPSIERNIEMYRQAVANTEQMLLDLRPAPPLDESNWQQQLFGGLCKLVGVSTERVTGTPLAGTLGQAAEKIKKNKRRPDELPSMWQTFRTDARFRWMTGRGDMGKLMMLFASNAAVL